MRDTEEECRNCGVRIVPWADDWNNCDGIQRWTHKPRTGWPYRRCRGSSVMLAEPLIHSWLDTLTHPGHTQSRQSRKETKQ